MLSAPVTLKNGLVPAPLKVNVVRLVVDRWINNRHLRAVEDVEAFHQNSSFTLQ